ncbi:MAG: PilZ domain-containing protein [Myxococcota bacterium]|nr:PilZ domain-containing protein [Myxococcota bacterium]
MYKRYELRRSFNFPLEVITSDWDEPIDLIASDLSPLGAYIESELFPGAGEHVVCSFNLLRGRPEYCFFGEVTRINFLRRRTDNGRPGFGIKFLDTTPVKRIQIRHSLRGLPPPIPSVRRTRIEIARLEDLM